MSDPVRKLDRDACWEFLRRHEFGRLAFHLAGEVHITPINYAVDGQTLLFRTSEGNKLLGVVMNDDVAFEIDEYSDDHATSVILRGTARVLEGQEAYRADNVPLRPWVSTEKHTVVEITPTEMSGRSFDLDKPWTHMR
ncbi:pyridoxamine 5'-phosphate oxidase family protein [Marihabitans asiaticum]|uniref:Nitroimidazol reductase NimA-like FMN-containing flavoprotein (Pyridoxamine 5'-phosphate oxidase superfamily) n=1 Tax=Marihabitans asiaticum TaxID=415218 RepID=A0A560W7N1_9MICO|nr:pyridoxamine 5'-phosphate oxidase family protein [Marihabitans asiaticum]TWD13622.1 nitroimidazol reductase NimA-like FMN-containing flavoprotein (pyridoxamine 5'-phosphate oxidase superfamily) [Marihabitans asiaticum]